MDYQEEQAQELEILTSIYDEEEFERTPKFSYFSTNVQKYHPQNTEFESFPTRTNLILVPTCTTLQLTPAQFSLHVILPPTYPETIPILSLSLTPTSPRSTIPKDHHAEILAKLNAAAEENLGMAMIFTLVSILKETLEELLVSHEAKEKEAIRLAEEREKQRLREEVDIQIRGLRRTPVTYELFLEWKRNFDAWKEAERKKGNDVENVRGRNKEKERREDGRLSGREVFERAKAETDEGFDEGEEDGLVEREKSDEEEDEKVDLVAGQVREMTVET